MQYTLRLYYIFNTDELSMTILLKHNKSDEWLFDSTHRSKILRNFLDNNLAFTYSRLVLD